MHVTLIFIYLFFLLTQTGYIYHLSEDMLILSRSAIMFILQNIFSGCLSPSAIRGLLPSYDLNINNTLTFSSPLYPQVIVDNVLAIKICSKYLLN